MFSHCSGFRNGIWGSLDAGLKEFGIENKRLWKNAEVSALDLQLCKT